MISLLSSGEFIATQNKVNQKNQNVSSFLNFAFCEAPIPEKIFKVFKGSILFLLTLMQKMIISSELIGLRYHQIDLRNHQIDVRYHKTDLIYHQINLRYHQIDMRYHQIDWQICPYNSDLNSYFSKTFIE